MSYENVDKMNRLKTSGLRKSAMKFFCIVLLLAFVWVVAFAVSLCYAASKMVEARDGLIEVKNYVLELSFEQANDSLSDASRALSGVSRVAPVIYSFQWLPYVGVTVRSTMDTISSTIEVVSSLRQILLLGEDIMRLSGISQESLDSIDDGTLSGITFDDLSTDTKRAILKRFCASGMDFELLSARISLIESEFSLLDKQTNFSPFLSLIKPLRQELTFLKSQLELVSVFTGLLPTFAGLDQPSTSLLLFLNNNELRPSGGFIGSYGVLTAYGGDITKLETEDVYALDDLVSQEMNPSAPSPIQRYNATSKWLFRDSNWSPDFSQSAHTAVEFFLREASFIKEENSVAVATEINQVIGMTPTYISDLLEITGPITLGGQTFTSENIADALEYQVEYGYALKGKPITQRKEILADLVAEMKTRLYSLPASQWKQVISATDLALTEKQLFFYSMLDDVQQIIEKVKWGGVVSFDTPDSVMVVDANLASLKSDPVVKRDIRYEIIKDKIGRWLGKVNITYKHTGNFDWKTTRYRTYTRLYVPIGSHLINIEGSLLDDLTNNPSGAKGPIDIYDDLGMTSFGTFTSVEPGSEQVLEFEFELSSEVEEAIENGEYDLTFIKQLGAQNNSLTLDLDFDKNLRRATPSEEEGEWGDDVYRLNTILDQDIKVHVQL